MSWITERIRRAAHFPVETILLILSVGLLILGAYLVGPWFSPEYPSVLPSIAAAIPKVGGTIVFGWCLVSASLPGLIVPFVMKKNYALKIKELSGMTLFLAFFFLSLLRILVYGFTPLIWIYPMMIALVCGVLRLYLEVRRK